MANWYGVYTRPRWEKKVAETLSRKKIENYCPMNQTCGSWADRRKVLYEPVFNAYVFVRLNSLQLAEVRKIEGVINLVYWQGKPAVIRDIEVEMMRRFLNEHKSIQLEKMPVNVHDIVKVTNETVDHTRIGEPPFQVVKLMLPSLGYVMTALETSRKTDVMVPAAVRTYESPVLNVG